MKKGFTLIELLAVIVLLSIIIAVAFPFIQGAINESKEKTCKEQKKSIEYAAQRWASDNSAKVNTKGTISVQELKDEGYLAKNKDIKNPLNGKLMNGNVSISYNSATHQYKYIYEVNCEI